MIKALVLTAGLALAATVAVFPVSAASGSSLGIDESGLRIFADDIDGDYICTAELMKRDPSRCPPYGPGAREARLDFLRARLPNPLPELAVAELDLPEDAITPYTFAYVRPLPAATYGHPEEAAAGLPPMREFLAGDNWVSVIGAVEYNGETWYEINSGEFVLASHIALASPSRFHGVVLSEQPQYPFAWLNRNTNPASSPGGAVREDIVLHRYDRVTLFAQVPMGDHLWYLIGPDQWIEQTTTARVDVDPPPDGVAPGEKWLEVNTFEQTLAAYEGERMVFATLISSGRTGTWTPNGLTRIWGKYAETPMQNRDVGNDSPAWYYLEDVEWTQYFNGAYALHAAYWHDSFGFTRSHGCINLSILDSKWLYQWTSPYADPESGVVYSQSADPGTWVYVHMSPPSPNISSAQ